MQMMHVYFPGTGKGDGDIHRGHGRNERGRSHAYGRLAIGVRVQAWSVVSKGVLVARRNAEWQESGFT